MQQDWVPQCSRLASALPARYLLHRTSAKEPPAACVGYSTDVHTSVNGSGSPQRFDIDSRSLWHGNWSGRSDCDLFCQRTTQNATHIYFAWLRCSVPLWESAKGSLVVSSCYTFELHELVAIHFNAVQKKPKMYRKHAPECIKMHHFKRKISIFSGEGHGPWGPKYFEFNYFGVKSILHRFCSRVIYPAKCIKME